MDIEPASTGDTVIHWNGPNPTIQELQGLLANLIADGTATPDTPIRIAAEGVWTGLDTYRMQRLYDDATPTLVFNWDEL